MEGMGFNPTAVTLALAVLLREGMVEKARDTDRDYEFTVYRLEEPGMNWLLTNLGELELRTNNPKPTSTDYDDIPF